MAWGKPPVKVDPDGFACEKGLHLLFCAREREFPDDCGERASQALIDGTNGHGLWHGVALGPGEALVDVDTGEISITVFGMHFVMRRRSSPSARGCGPTSSRRAT